jgi:hypothetical protein
MPYKRPMIQKPEKPHKIYDEWKNLGMLSDHEPGWIYPHIIDMLDEARVSLSQFSGVITRVNETDWSELKDDVAREKKSTMVLAAKRALMGFLKRPIEKYRSDVASVADLILRQTEPEKPNDPMTRMLQEIRFREIRDNLRKIEPKHRQAAVVGNLERMQAIIGNPDSSDVIIDGDALTAMRREYAFQKDPSLIEEEKDAIALYKTVRAKAAEINASAAKLLIINKLDDPTPPVEHFELFTPEGDHEKVFAEKRIASWDKKQAEISRQKELAETNQGLNLQAGARAGRVGQGLRH